MGKYLIGIDQSTQGTKALLFDQEGNLIKRTDKAHRQIINEKGWVSHDPEEIYRNTLEAVRNLVQESGIPAGDVVGVGISNQRETSLDLGQINRGTAGTGNCLAVRASC